MFFCGLGWGATDLKGSEVPKAEVGLLNWVGRIFPRI
jgi:hypothetical protein